MVSKNLVIVFISLCALISFRILAEAEQETFVSKNNSLVDEDALYKKANEILDNYTGRISKLEEAYWYLQKILESNPGHALAYVGLARVVYKAGYINYAKYDPESLMQAHIYLEKALEIDPKLFEAHLCRGWVYLFQKDLANVKKTVEEMEKIRPSSADANLLLAEVAAREKRIDEAIKRAKEVLAATDEKRLKRAAYGVLGPLYSYRKEYDLAKETHVARLELDPHSPWAKINYSSFLLERGEYDKAIEFSQSALDEMDFGMGHHVLSEAYYRKAYDFCWYKREYRKAEEIFKQVLEHDPDNANAYYGLGVCYRFISHELKDKEILAESEACLKKALEIDPDHELAKKELKKHAKWVGK